MSRAWAMGPAQPADLPGLRSLVATHALRGALLRRDPGEMAAHLSRWTVARLGRAVVGCVALEQHRPDLWEVRSLAVAEGCQGHGMASALLKAVLARAREVGAPRLFALTCERSLFARAGFSLAPGLRPGDSFHGRLIRPGCGLAMAELRAEAAMPEPARAGDETRVPGLASLAEAPTRTPALAETPAPWALPILAGLSNPRSFSHVRLSLA